MAAYRDHLILEGEFLLLSKKKAVYHVSLTRSGLFYYLALNNSTTYEEKYVQICDIVGCHSLEQSGNTDQNEERSSNTSPVHEHVDQNDCNNSEVTRSASRYSISRGSDTSSCGFIVFAYPFKKKLFSNKKNRTRQELAFEIIAMSSAQTFDERKKVAETWRNVINSLCRDLPVNLTDIPCCVPPPRGRMLVLINPFSGPGKANTIFKNEIAPMLHEACIPYKAIITEYAGHAGELMKTLNLSEWYGVVIIAGDGLIFETINGIMQRDDWASSIKFPVGCLPGGSGNALCCSIKYSAGEPVESSAVLHSTFVLVKHRVLPMDLVVVHIPDRTIFSFLSVAWGIVADIDFESEKYRKLGEARFTVGAIRRILGLRTYRGRVSFLPVAEYTPRMTPASSKVLSKIRRFSMGSRNNSKSTLNSLDSKSSSSECNNMNSKNNICHGEQHQGLEEESGVKNGVESSINIGSGDVHQGDNDSRLMFVEDNDGARSIERNNSCDMSPDIYHNGRGDVGYVNTCDEINVEPVDHSALLHAQDSKSSGSENMFDNDALISPKHSGIDTSVLAQNTLTNGNNDYSSNSDLQRKKHNAHSSVSYMSNGCSVENNHRMTILSDTQEIRVEQETYHVKTADNTPVPTPLLPPLDQDVPSNWVTLDESFVLAIAMVQTHLGSDIFAAPDAHLNDGHIHLMMVREGISRNTLLNLFLTFDQGTHIHSPDVDVVKVLAFRFEPATKEGNIMVDGERFDPTPIQGQILPGVARIMAIK